MINVTTHKELTGKTRYRSQTIGSFLNKRKVLVLEVEFIKQVGYYETTPPYYDSRDIFCWRDATVEDLQELMKIKGE